MSIINFSIPKTLEQRVNHAIKAKGFTSKAEFFRFAAMYFIHVIDKPFATEDERFSYLTDAITKEIQSEYKGKKLPPLEKQLEAILFELKSRS